MTPERLISLISPSTLDPQNLILGGVPEWTAADAAIATAGLQRHHAAAFRYRWGRDETVRSVLWGALMSESSKMAVKESWPSECLRLDGARRVFHKELVDMALLEEHYGFFMRSVRAQPALMEVNNRIWAKVLSPKYEAIRYCLDDWCERAHTHMKRKMRREAVG